MSIATLSFSAVVLSPLLLLVFDLFGRKAKESSTRTARGSRR